jgi:hypothetical protein
VDFRETIASFRYANSLGAGPPVALDASSASAHNVRISTAVSLSENTTPEHPNLDHPEMQRSGVAALNRERLAG